MITVTGSRRSPCFRVAISLKGSRSCFPDDPFGPRSPASGQFLSRTLPRRLPLTADGPEFGQGLGPALGVGLQDQCLLAELSRLDAPAFDFVVERLPANAITCAKFAHRKCLSGRE